MTQCIHQVWITKFVTKLYQTIWHHTLPFKQETITHFTIVPDKGVQTIIIERAKHIDLSDRGGPRINEEILKSIIQFLK